MIAMFLSIVVSCNDKWDDHYSTNESIVFDSPIAELLSSKPDASKFVEALKTTKMLKINDDLIQSMKRRSLLDILSEQFQFDTDAKADAKVQLRYHSASAY